MSVGHIQAKKKVQWKGGWWGSLFEMRGVAVENVPVVTLSHCNVCTLAEMKYSLLPTPRRHWWAAPTPPLSKGVAAPHQYPRVNKDEVKESSMSRTLALLQSLPL